MNREAHWNKVFRKKAVDDVSWYAPRLERSLSMIREAVAPPAEIIDVGCGASTLVDDLLSLGYSGITVLDVSAVALEIARKRLGNRAEAVHWIASDVMRARLPADRYDLWHDRAVFHFLTDPGDRKAYAATATRSVKSGGHLVIAAFALDGPTRCSGLDVVRHDGASLGRDLGPGFVLEQELHETHVTPSGKAQKFVYCSFRRS